MKTLNCILAFTASFILLSCTPKYVIKEPTKQPSEISIQERNLIQEGANAYKRKDYQEAVDRYQVVLKTNPNNVLAMYELALTYSAMNKHEKSLETGLLALEYRSPELNKVYLLVGTELDYLGEKSDAIDVYKNGLKRYPDDHLLYYNLGITQFSCDEIEEAKASFKSSATLRPAHAGSHLGLAQLFSKEGNKIPALFAFCRFLILDPSSDRAESARQSVLTIIHGDLKTNPKNPNQITVSVDPDEPKSEGDFSSLNFFMSLNSALQVSMKDNKSAREQKIDIFDGIFSIAGGSTSKENKTGFVWQYYVPYFFELNKKNFTGTFVDYAILDLNDHSDTVKTFLKWSEDYKWPATTH
jgi:tetratricopeptide (TPR) repeat protein